MYGLTIQICMKKKVNRLGGAPPINDRFTGEDMWIYLISWYACISPGSNQVDFYYVILEQTYNRVSCLRKQKLNGQSHKVKQLQGHNFLLAASQPSLAKAYFFGILAANSKCFFNPCPNFFLSSNARSLSNAVRTNSHLCDTITQTWYFIWSKF